MTCEYLKLPGGGVAIVCHRGPKTRCRCGRPTVALCDWKTKPRDAAKKASARNTCSIPVCSGCRTKVGTDKDLCPAHARLWAKHPKNPNRTIETNNSTEKR